MWKDNAKANPKTPSFTHDIPTKLIGAAKDDPQSQEAFVKVIRPIVFQHYQAALAASQPESEICGAPTKQAALSPVSWLHVAEDPFVTVLANAICNKPACDTKVRQKVQGLMTELSAAAPTRSSAGGGQAEASKERKIGEIMPCRVCKKVENTLRCSRCNTAFYCGKEHQKMYWPFHKAACKLIASGNQA